MTTFRSRWERVAGLLATAGIFGGLVAIAIEMYFTDRAYGAPSTGRPTELVTSHGAHLWVSDAIWWVYKIGSISFFAGLGLALTYALLNRFKRT